MGLVFSLGSNPVSITSQPSNLGKLSEAPGASVSSFVNWDMTRTLEKEVATHSRILAWKIPWTEEPGGLKFKGWQRVRHDWATELPVHVTRHPPHTVSEWRQRGNGREKIKRLEAEQTLENRRTQTRPEGVAKQQHNGSLISYSEATGFSAAMAAGNPFLFLKCFSF